MDFTAAATSFGKTTEVTEVCQTYAEYIKGKTILLTGPTISGIGYTTAEAIARSEPKELILAGRSSNKLQEAQEKLLQAVPGATTSLLQVDISSLASVRAAVKEVNRWDKPIDVLINNAGVMDTPYELTKEGYEMQLVTNHLGPFLFTTGILPQILKSQGKRIVNLSSVGHNYGPVNWDDPNWSKGGYTPNLGYGQSKTGMILFARSLAQKYGSQGLKAFSLHPGAIISPLQKHWSFEIKMEMNKVYGALYDENGTPNPAAWQTLSQGSSTTCRAAFDPYLEPNGAYLTDCQIAEEACNEYAKDPANVERIWSWSENLISKA